MRHCFWLASKVFHFDFALAPHLCLRSTPCSAPCDLDHRDAHGCHCLTRARRGATAQARPAAAPAYAPSTVAVVLSYNSHFPIPSDARRPL
eukprot:6212315-Pleurochrysis_carterae.AAC.2